MLPENNSSRENNTFGSLISWHCEREFYLNKVLNIDNAKRSVWVIHLWRASWLTAWQASQSHSVIFDSARLLPAVNKPACCNRRTDLVRFQSPPAPLKSLRYVHSSSLFAHTVRQAKSRARWSIASVSGWKPWRNWRIILPFLRSTLSFKWIRTLNPTRRTSSGGKCFPNGALEQQQKNTEKQNSAECHALRSML